MRILVADDDKEIRDFLKSSLESECFAVDTASDGDEGSYLARVHDYDILVVDNIMPKKSGFELCQEVRRHGKETPILILSIQSDAEDKVSLLNAGADDYLSKPFSYRELQSRIRALLRRPRTLTHPILRVDDLILDATQQKVRRGGKEIYLTRKEFALTEYLMRNSGAVVSRGMLMEHVWNDEIDPFSNTIEAHILNLRKKIDSPYRRKLIHTVPGRGYKIESIGRAVFN